MTERRGSIRALVVCAVCIAAAACKEEAGSARDASDSGVVSAPQDAGGAVDAEGRDAGGVVDADMNVDAGTSDAGALADDASSSADDAASDAGLDAGPPVPTVMAAGIAYCDGDPASGATRGTLQVAPATAPDGVEEYRVYWANIVPGVGVRRTTAPAVVTFPVGGPFSFEVPMGTNRPAEGASFLVVTANAFGEMANGRWIGADSATSYLDISAGQGDGSGQQVDLVLDTANQKMLVVAENFPNGDRLSLFRCDDDGTDCTHTDISAGQAVDSGRYPRAAIDTVNQKLLVVTANIANQSKPSLFRCDLDGTDCTHHDISAGQGPSTGFNWIPLVDTANQKLIGIGTNGGIATPAPRYYRCDLDGTNCTEAAISVTTAAEYATSALIDPVEQKFLILTRDAARSQSPSLIRCNLDNTGCVRVDLSGTQPSPSAPGQALLDPVNRKLLVVTSAGGLLRCDPDGTACTHTALGAPSQVQGWGTSLSLDPVAQKLNVVARQVIGMPNTSALLDIRCDLDGTDCVLRDLSACRDQDAVTNLRAATTPDGRLLVAVTNYQDRKPAVYITDDP